MTEPLISMLPYGYGGAGKSHLATSAIWDHRENKQLRRGYWLTFGTEKNPSIQIPDITIEDAVKNGAHGRIRFTAPSLDSDKFIEDYEKFCRWMHKQNYKAPADDKPVQAVVVDGLSEFDMLFISTFENTSPDAGNKYAKWEDLIARFFGMFQVLDTEELGAHVLMTARVQEKRKGTFDRNTQSMVGADPDFMASDYRPSVRGRMGIYMPHYFSIVPYLEATRKLRKTDSGMRNVPVHLAHMLPTEDYFVKNVWEERWITAGHPDVMEQPTFDQILEKVRQL